MKYILGMIASLAGAVFFGWGSVALNGDGMMAFSAGGCVFIFLLTLDEWRDSRRLKGDRR